LTEQSFKASKIMSTSHNYSRIIIIYD